MVLGFRRTLGLGPVSLRSLELLARLRLGMEPGVSMGPGLGLVALQRPLNRMGALVARNFDLRDQLSLLRQSLDLRSLPQLCRRLGKYGGLRQRL